MKHPKLQGSMVALVTPFKQDRIDIPQLQALVEFHIAAGTQAIVAAGTTGESGTLSHDEKCQVIEAVVAAVAGRLPVIAGTACIATKDCIQLTKQAKALGATAALIMTPAYVKPTQAGLYAHYATIADATAFPIILYNVPPRTGCDLLPKTVAGLSRIEAIIGFKEAVPDMARLETLKAGVAQDFCIYSGDDLSCAAWLLAGAQGVISVTANVVPRLMAQLCKLALAGNVAETEALQAKLLPLHQALFCESNPIPVKWAVAHLGLINPEPRLPLTPLSYAYRTKLETICNQLRE